MVEVDVKQGTTEWLRLRLGKITGTRLENVFKSNNLTLVDELIAEIETEIVDDTFQSKSMYEGKENEPYARMIYERVKGYKIDEVGFCLAEWNDYLALSPDGFTQDRKGGVEIKCPKAKTHVQYIRMNVWPNDYKYQKCTYFLVNEQLDWMDFVSYNPHFKVRPMYIKRVYRHEIEAELEEAKAGLIKFTEKLGKYYKQVTS